MNKVDFLSDTNIFIKLYHAKVDSTDLCNQYVKEFSRLGFVEPVHYEINRTPNVSYKHKQDFLSVYNSLSDYYDVVYIDELDILTQQIYIDEMNNFGYQDYKGIEKAVKDIGEKATILLSHLLEIPIIHTDDYEFIDYVNDNRNKFPDTELIDLNTVLQKLIPNDKERIAINKSIQQNDTVHKSKVNKQAKLDRENENEKIEKEKMEKSLEKLLRKYNKPLL